MQTIINIITYILTLIFGKSPPHPVSDTILISKEEKQYYLSTPEWQYRRQLIIQRDKVCRICKSSANEVHHLHYRTWKKERLQDLVLLCRGCHQKVHDKYGYDYNNDFPISI